MNGRRLVLTAVTAAVSLSGLLAAAPAKAGHDDCEDYVPRRRSYYSDYDRGYDRGYGYYRPQRRVYYGSPGYSYRTRRVTTTTRYSCDDCGERFASRYWLNYHNRHTDCD